VKANVSVPPHALEVQEHVAPAGQVAVQLVQTPLAPHAVAEVPAEQVPPVAAEQQPPLHVWVEEHAVVHAPVAVSQACPAGQSVATAQPHLPLARHAVPEALPAQETQAPPEAPQAAFDVPAEHIPALQQPPLHVSVAEQVVVHAPVVVSHASSAGQSVASLQPHAPLGRHALPVLPPTHETQAPLAPQAACTVPDAHVPALQQPPLHTWVGEHVVVHFRVVVSHASSVGHSAEEVQPVTTSGGLVSSRTSVVPSLLASFPGCSSPGRSSTRIGSEVASAVFSA